MTEAPDRSGDPVAEDFDFESALDELEDIVRALDGDDVGLDEAIALFRKGLARVEAANAWLDDASGRVEEVIEASTGALESRPLDDVDPADD